ncbi:MAG: hypothetical protein KJ583_06545, partial [Nanoarchaeota archaeon]|nr:hypothetical protein [Nanoarchaeota archaeon]MBU2442823.1 hypothetical protein [Nanoarchaeota archaeon]
IIVSCSNNSVLEEKTLMQNYSTIIINGDKLSNWTEHPNFHNKCMRGPGWQICGDFLELPLNCTYSLDEGVYYYEDIICYSKNAKRANWSNDNIDQYIDVFGDYGVGYETLLSRLNNVVRDLGYDPVYLKRTLVVKEKTHSSNIPGEN